MDPTGFLSNLLPTNLLKKVPTFQMTDNDEEAVEEFEQRVRVYQDMLRESEAKVA